MSEILQVVLHRLSYTHAKFAFWKMLILGQIKLFKIVIMNLLDMPWGKDRVVPSGMYKPSKSLLLNLLQWSLVYRFLFFRSNDLNITCISKMVVIQNKSSFLWFHDLITGRRSFATIDFPLKCHLINHSILN